MSNRATIDVETYPVATAEPPQKKHCDPLVFDEEETPKSVVPLSLQCGICFEVLMEPVQCQKGHCFCRNCFVTWIDQEKVDCPMCRVRVAGFICDTPSFIKEEIEKLALSCKHPGCMFLGNLAALKHHGVACEYRPVLCLFCNHSVLAKFFDSHIETLHSGVDMASWHERLSASNVAQAKLVDRYKNGRSIQFRLALTDEGWGDVTVAEVTLRFYVEGEKLMVKPIKTRREELIRIAINAEVTTPSKSKFLFNNCKFSNSGMAYKIAADGQLGYWMTGTFTGHHSGEKLKKPAFVDILLTWRYCDEE